MIQKTSMLKKLIHRWVITKKWDMLFTQILCNSCGFTNFYSFFYCLKLSVNFCFRKQTAWEQLSTLQAGCWLPVDRDLERWTNFPRTLLSRCRFVGSCWDECISTIDRCHVKCVFSCGSADWASSPTCTSTVLQSANGNLSGTWTTQIFTTNSINPGIQGGRVSGMQHIVLWFLKEFFHYKFLLFCHSIYSFNFGHSFCPINDFYIC